MAFAATDVGGLAQRWSRFGPDMAGVDYDQIRLFRLQLRDTEILLHRHHGRVHIPAFTGAASYELSAKASHALALLRFGARVGVGTQTGYGFGRIEIGEVRPISLERRRVKPANETDA
ncbi:CRISPR system precrRNA processing endoribonuclease RAMP protein Cas6 [Deinococcus radiophilus]|uniref:CRISPR system precrRNA processing endoribonuclease RAMP protein Cas6 n=1 Tax=Deinococcus radiophilus TaxID=32062 RepID=UPI0036186043